MGAFFTVKKGDKTKQVRGLAQLREAKADGWKPAGDIRLDTEIGEQTYAADEAISQLEAGEATGIVGQDEIRARRGAEFIEERYGDDPAQTFGEAGLSALTFGRFDPGDLSEITEGDAGAAAARAEARPGVSAAGSVAGTVLGALAPGGLGKILPGGIAGRVATRAGEKVLAKTGSKVAQYGVEGLVDGAFLGPAQSYANAVIADKPVNVESLLASMPSEMLYSGLAGGALGAGVAGLGKLSNRIKAGKLAAKADDVAIEANQHKLRWLNEDVVKARTKVDKIQATKGTDIAEFREAKKELANANKALEVAEREATKLAAAQSKDLPAVLNKFSDDLTTDIVDAVKHTTDQVEVVGNKVQLSPRGSAARLTKQDFIDMGDEFHGWLGRRVGKSAGDLKLRDYTNYIGKQAQAINKSAARLKKLSGGKKFTQLDADKFNEFAAEYSKLQKLQNEYASALKPVGGDYMTAPLNLSKLDQLEASFPNFATNKFYDDAGELTEFGRHAEGLGLDLDGLTDHTSESLARAWATGKSIDDVASVGASWPARARQEVAQEVFNKTKLRSEGAAEALEAAKLEKIDAQERLGMFKAQGLPTTAPKPTETGGAPKWLTGLAGRNLGRAFDAITSGPARIARGVEKFISVAGKPRRGTVPAATAILAKIRFDDDLGERPKKGRRENFARVARELDSLVENPEKLRQRIQESTKEIQQLKPGLGNALAEKAFQRAMFLHGLVPRSPNVSAFGTDNWQPSNTEIDKFTRIAAAAEDPYSILDDLNAGTLTQEAVDTVKQLYPEIYHSIQMELVERADEIKQSVSYQGRLQLGILFQAPTDEVLQPGFIRMMQENYALRAQEQEQQGGGQFSTPGAAQKSITSTQTASQRIESK